MDLCFSEQYVEKMQVHKNSYHAKMSSAAVKVV